MAMSDSIAQNLLLLKEAKAYRFMELNMTAVNMNYQ